MAAASTASVPAIAAAPTTGSSSGGSGKQYLIRCRIGESKGLANFRIPEFISLAKLAGLDEKSVLDESKIDPRSAFFYATLPSVEVCHAITSRAVLTKYVLSACLPVCLSVLPTIRVFLSSQPIHDSIWYVLCVVQRNL